MTSAPRTAIDVCPSGAVCMDDRPGHAMTAMRLRLASATPRGWRDAVVVGVSAEGEVLLELWATGELRIVWHHLGLAGAVQAGTPVALQPAYSVLAVGRHRFSVAQL
ncbi:MAG: hypothetical protein JWP66_59 [Naasia sp.]|jgi:hypothetical protein|nr:hypothetical protein [Naasia sp.]